MTKRFALRSGILTGMLAAGAVITGVSATPAAAADNFARDCAAGNFCAYDGGNYSVRKLLTSSYSGSSKVDVANNLTASAANKTDNDWCGWNDGTLIDSVLYRFSPHTGVTTLGSANDKIDYFRARSC
jgi:hypothetical protein